MHMRCQNASLMQASDLLHQEELHVRYIQAAGEVSVEETRLRTGSTTQGGRGGLVTSVWKSAKLHTPFMMPAKEPGEVRMAFAH